MKVIQKDVTYLHGNLNHIGVTNNIINSLAASLQKAESVGEKNLRIE